MIKVVLVLAGVAVIGGALYWGYTTFLSPQLGSTIPNLGSLFVTAQEKIQPIITYVQENAWQVGATVAGVSGFFVMVSSKIHGALMQKKEIEATIKQNDLQSSLFQAQGEVLGLQNQLTEAQGTIKTLEGNASTVSELASQLQAKVNEVERLQAEKNALERMVPQIKTVEQMIKESKQVP